MKYAKNTSYTIKNNIDATTPIILPIGAVEAHGPHLPLETDNILAEKYSDLIAENVNGLVLPVIPYGQVWSLKNFPGSLTISNETLIQLIYELASGLYKQGARIFVLVSGHLGNMVALKESGRKIQEKYTDMKVLYIFYPKIQKLAEEVRESKSSHATYIHACEIETSLLLYLSPEDVNMNLAISESPEIPMIADFTPTPWETFTDTTVLGDAKLATQEKGKFLITKTLELATEMIKSEINQISKNYGK